MKKALVILLVIFMVVGAAVASNPSETAYSQWLTQEVSQRTQSTLARGLVNLLGGTVVNHTTVVDNFGAFSIFHTDALGERVTALGLFHIFIPLSLPASASSTSERNTSTSSNTASASRTFSKRQPSTASSLAASSPDNPLPNPARVKEKRVGTVEVISNQGTYRLPVIGLQATYGITSQTVPSITPPGQLSPVDFDVPANLAKSLAVYWVTENSGGEGVPEGIEFLAPKSWHAISAGVGVNGFAEVELESANGQQITYGYQSDGPAEPSIGEYFPNLRSWAEKQVPEAPASEFQPPAGTKIVYLSQDARLGEETVAFSYQSPTSQFVTNGVATEENQQAIGIQVGTVVTSNHALATTLLNFLLQQTMNDQAE